MRCRPPRIAVEPTGSARIFCALVALLVASCDGPGNSGKFAPLATLIDAVPWESGVLPHLDANGAVVPSLPEYPPVADGIPDPGASRTDCAGFDQYEFSTGWFDDFELSQHGADPGETTGIASGWASYDDLSKYSFHAPGDATWYPGLKGTFDSVWGLPSVRMAGPSCDGKPNDWVLHFEGGLFRKWGGGISHAFTDPDGRYRPKERDAACPAGDDFCSPPIPADASTDSAGLPTKAASGGDYLQSHDFFDVSSYDGIAFWARRGPEGSAQSFVILTDKFTSSRLARENQTYCRRIRECHTRCLSGSPCAPDDPTSAKPIYRCYDPKQGPLPTNIPIESQMDLMYPRCGQSACTSPTSYLDPDFDTKSCSPYTFPAADESGEFCFNPGQDAPPPSRDERCQDGWQTVVQLSSDWKFYALPWDRFGQVGFGKKAPYMDLKSLDVLAFGATMGWADIYLDNITLYRRKK